MTINNIDQFKIRLAHNQARRGRPKTALPEVRAAGYKDQQGKDVLSEGLKPWHERIVDYMVLNPHAKIVDVAAEFKITPQWAGRLMKTDAFVEYYQTRMAGHQELMHTTIIHKMQGVAVKSLDKISAKLDSQDATFTQAKEAADMTLKSLGYTSNNPAMSVNLKDKDGSQLTVQIGANAVEQAKQRIQQRMQGQSIEQPHDGQNYNYVTAAMDLGDTEAVDVDAARDVTPTDDES